MKADKGYVRRHKGRGRLLVAISTVVAMIAIAGCGSQSDVKNAASGATVSAGALSGATASGVTAAGAAVKPGIAQARSIVAQYSKTQPPMTVPLLPRRPPTNETFSFISCTLPGCEVDSSGAAAKALGWKYRLVTTQPTPESYVAAFNQVVQQSPDLFVYVGFLPDSLVSAQLAAMSQKKVPMARVTSPDATRAPGVLGCYACQPVFVKDGQLMADVVAADAGGGTEVGLVTDSNLKANYAPVVDAFTAELKTTDPDAQIVTVDANTQAPATQNGTTVVNFVHTHPNVKYLVYVVAALALGSPEALQSAGLDKQVKIITRVPSDTDIANLQAGKYFAIVIQEGQEMIWRAVDALARSTEGQPITDPDPAGWHQILYRDDVKSGKMPAAPGFPQAFLTAWHVS